MQSETALTAYQAKLRRKYGKLNVLGKRDRSFGIEEVYIQTGLSNMDDDEEVKPDNLFANDSRLVVLGLPGSGKSTLLRYVAFTSSKDGSSMIPIYFSAKRYLSRRKGEERKRFSLPEFIDLSIGVDVGEKNARSILNSESFGKSDTLLLIDGLDEITPEQSSELNSELEDFLFRHPEARVILTSRFGGFQDSEYRAMEFGIYRLKDADVDDIKLYVRATCETSTQDQIISSITGDERLLEMAGNPFLLAMMCSDPSVLVPIARKRALLFQACTRYLLRAEDYQKGRPRPVSSFDTLERALEIIALYFFKLDRKDPLKIEEVTFCLISAIKDERLRIEGDNTPNAAKSILKQISDVSGLLQILGNECEFVHRSIWEYFAGRGMLSEPKENILNKTNDPNWEEPIRFYIGLVDEKLLSEVINGIWDRNRGLALRSLNERETFPSEVLIGLYSPLYVEQRLEVISQLRASVRLSQGNSLKQKRLIVDTLSSILKVEKNCHVLYECLSLLDGRKEPECRNLISKALLLDLEPVEARRRRVIENSGSPLQKFVKVPGGTFIMGTDSIIDPRETPAHSVRLSSFEVSACLVTNRMYYNSNFPYAENRQNPYSKEPDQPVNKVNWYEAYMFAKWLGANLPREAEWEYACRAGGIDDGAFQTQASISEYAWYGDNSNNRTHAVGTKRPNSFGLYDMLGNLREWCNDWYSDDYYKECKGEVVDPEGPAKGSEKVLRGGCFDWAYTHLRPTYRNYNTPDNVYFVNGFRLVVRGESSG